MAKVKNEEEAKVSNQACYKVPPSMVEFEKNFNARYDMGEMKALQESIAQHGIKMPLRGYKEGEKYIITDGHRRAKAAIKLYKDGQTDLLIPIIPEPKGYTDEQRTMDLIICNSGKHLTMLEKSNVVARLMTDYQMTEADVSRKIGESKVAVNNLVLLGTATDRTKAYIKADNITASAVVEMLRAATPEKVEEKVIKIVESAGDDDKGKSKGTIAAVKKPSVKRAMQFYDEVTTKHGINEEKEKVFSKVLSFFNGEMEEADLEKYLFSKGF